MKQWIPQLKNKTKTTTKTKPNQTNKLNKKSNTKSKLLYCYPNSYIVIQALF